MRHVVFVAPYPLQTTLRFSEAIAGLDDVKLTGVFQQKPQGDAAKLFANVALVDNVFDPAQVVDGVRSLVPLHGPPHRVLGILEELQGALSQARRVLGLPGIDPETSLRFRDKGRTVRVHAQEKAPRRYLVEDERDGQVARRREHASLSDALRDFAGTWRGRLH